MYSASLLPKAASNFERHSSSFSTEGAWTQSQIIEISSSLLSLLYFPAATNLFLIALTACHSQSYKRTYCHLLSVSPTATLAASGNSSSRSGGQIRGSSVTAVIPRSTAALAATAAPRPLEKSPTITAASGQS